MRRLSKAEIVAVTLFGTGFSPIAPGTVASALSCVIIWFLPEALLRWPWALLMIPVTLAGVYWSKHAVESFELVYDPRFRRLRRPNPNTKDPDPVVIDEFIGQWITLLAASHTIWGFAAGFIAFRLMDVTKPLGIRKLENAGGGWGVMLDDIAAGVFGAVLLWAARQLAVAVLY